MHVKDNCRVSIRIRPSQETSIIKWSKNSILVSTFNYTFDSVLEESSNQQLYNSSARNIVDAAMKGINGTIMAYGQTASGKTYSMMGYDNEPGVIPQSIDHIFEFIRSNTGREYLLRVAYIEIYNEVLKDLLAPDSTDLRILNDSKRGILISPLKEEIVTSPKQVMKVIQRGEMNRHWGTTDYNSKSSRSHTILQIIIESRDSSSDFAFSSKKPPVTVSILNLIDLAGSERADTDLDRRKEGAYINKSLLTLANVIGKLTDEKSSHIPYFKLT